MYRPRSSAALKYGLMAESNTSALLSPVQLSTISRQVFSVAANLPPDVEAEVQYRVDQRGIVKRDDMGNEMYFYWECFVPTEGHFPLLTAEILDAPESRQSDEDLACVLDAELSQLRTSGVLGNVVLPESIYAFVKRKLESGEFKTPMEIVFAVNPGSRLP